MQRRPPSPAAYTYIASAARARLRAGGVRSAPPERAPHALAARPRRVRPAFAADNQIGNEGALALASALENNTILTTLSI
mgnify:CR=1 FL=1